MIAGVAAKAARRYARRVFWADPADLEQEAYVAALDARKSWEPDCGVPFTAYAWRACMNHLRTFCWRNSSPVSETQMRLETLRGVHRSALGIDLPDASPLPDEAYLEAEWVNAVRDQLSFLLIERLGSKGAAAAMRVLVDEEGSAAVAADAGLETVIVYRSARRARETIASNAVLYALWKDRTQ